GLDLSGTVQGAGGVGGALALNSIANGLHFYAFDGNGNTRALVKAADGTASANYEYDAFSVGVRCTGSVANENPYRFSTKRADDAADIVQYEYRICRPSSGT